MTSEPAVSLEFALAFAAIAVAIVVWVFARIIFEYREMGRRREAIRQNLTEDQNIEWEALQETLGILRDRANAWSTLHFVEAQRVLETLDEFESDALRHPDELAAAASRARSALAKFDEEPDGARLPVIEKHLSDSPDDDP